MKLIGTTISFVIACNEIKNLNFKEDGTGRLIMKSKKIDINKEIIVFLNFNKDDTHYLMNREFKKEIIFIYGIYQAIKDKKNIYFIDIEVNKIIIKDENEVIKKMTDKIELGKAFEVNDLNYLEKMYKKICDHK